MLGLVRAFIRGVQRNVDLLAVWMGLLVAQHYVPITHILARDDLLPWMILTLGLVALLRARPFGYGPHPMLTPRVSAFGKWTSRGAAALAPVALMFVYDAGYALDPRALAQDPSSLLVEVGTMVGTAAACVVGVLVLVNLGGTHGQTAWNPERGTPVGPIVGTGVLVSFIVFVGGFGAGRAQSLELLQNLGRSYLIGLSFLTAGLLLARIQNHRQRQAAGRKDGRPYRQLMFPAILATAGPSVSLVIVFTVAQGLAFHQAFVVSLLIVVWAGVVWPKPTPVAVSCVLHEIEPKGGADPSPMAGQANAFDIPPEGALRFNPLDTKRTLVMHPWIVPVRTSRIAELDDPIRPLWDLPPPPIHDHILGDAAFEPDETSKQDQWELITVRLRGRADVQTMGGDAGTRRMVILRAFPAPGESAKPRLATYRWEENVPADTVQVLDPTTEVAKLRDGDVLVLSSEGVARAFEVEIGAPVYRVADADQFRVPQLEDYVEAG